MNPAVLVRVCDECCYGSNDNRCVVCGNVGVTDAYYCRECVQQEKDRDGCPKIVNLGAVRCGMRRQKGVWHFGFVVYFVSVIQLFNSFSSCLRRLYQSLTDEN